MCGLTAAEVDALKRPTVLERLDAPVPQPIEPHPTSVQSDLDPRRAAARAAYTDDEVWERFSETTPPVVVDDDE